MRSLALVIALALAAFSALFPLRCQGQSAPVMVASSHPSPDPNAASPSPNAAVDQPAPTPPIHPLPSRIAVGVKISPLGPGIEVATPVTYRSNLRFGFNAFSYGRGFTSDGIQYNANLNFRSVETHFDWFPFAGSFHLSPGAMVYNGNQLTANTSVGAGQQFTLNNVNYISDPASPVSGTGKVDFNKVAPTFLLGWGNLLPRSHRHFSVPFEFGAVFAGAPKTVLNLTGSACDTTGANCANVATDPAIQSNVVAQQNKIKNDISFLKAYPVISVGFGYKF